MNKNHPFCRVPIQADDYVCECEREEEVCDECGEIHEGDFNE